MLSQTGNKLDAVVHNAGVAVAGTLEDVPESELRRVMETNFFGVLELTRALLPTFRAQRRGRIVIVSSEAAFMGQPTNSIYCASKWAIEGWAEAIAYELEHLSDHQQRVWLRQAIESGRYRQPLAADADTQNREINVRIGEHDFGVELAPVGEHDLQ